MHNDGIHNLYSWPNIITMIKTRRMRWVGHVRCMGKIRVGYKIVRKHEGKRLPGRLGHR
jgi:hypothetical protein